MVELLDGVRRLTFRLPFGIDHVHCYLLRGSDGGWTIVDTGLGLEETREGWRSALSELDAPVTRVVVTHFHPDHVGAAADVAELTHAPVFQGAIDYQQCLRAWGEEHVAARLPEYMREHGLPDDELAAVQRDSDALRGLVRFARDPEPLVEGDSVDGWQVVHLPGHADGHLVLVRGGVLIAGDTILGTITPNVGLYPDARPDPLADYLSSLGRIAELAPRVAFAGHGEPIGDPAPRAREIISHHRERLEQTAAALERGPATAYEASLALFPGPLAPTLRRFALAETRAHLEYLARRGHARRTTRDGVARYEHA